MEGCTVLSSIRKEFGDSIADVVIGHGRLWILFENGVLQAYHIETLEPVSSFEKGEWSDSTEHRLSLSDHFLYCLSKRQGSWVLRTIDAAAGEVEPPPIIVDLESPAVFFESLHGAVLGRDRASRFSVVKLYASADGVVEQDRRSMKVSSGGLDLPPWWGTLGQAEFLLCPDGGIRQWMEEDERYETFWPNEGRAWVGHPHRWKEFLLFPIAGRAGLRFLRVAPSGSMEERELYSRGNAEESFSSCVIGDRLYFLTRARDLVWHLQSYSLVEGELENSVELGGSSDLLGIELRPAAVAGLVYILISGRSSNKWTFWGWNIKEQKVHHQLAGQPHADERITFHWEGANTWMVRHSRRDKGGIVQCLPVT